jgi:hypothetical protein
MKPKDQIIEMELDKDAIYKPNLAKTRNHQATEKNVKGRNRKSISTKNIEKYRPNQLEILVDQAISQLEHETRQLIKSLFR